MLVLNRDTVNNCTVAKKCNSENVLDLKRLVFVDTKRPWDSDRNVYEAICYPLVKKYEFLHEKNLCVYFTSLSNGVYYIFNDFSKMSFYEKEEFLEVAAPKLRLLMDINNHDTLMIYCSTDILSFKSIEKFIDPGRELLLKAQLQKRFEVGLRYIKQNKAAFIESHNVHKNGYNYSLFVYRKDTNSEFKRFLIDNGKLSYEDFTGFLVMDDIISLDFLEDLLNRINPRVVITPANITPELMRLLDRHSVYYFRL